eukprot:gene11020-14800_t
MNGALSDIDGFQNVHRRLQSTPGFVDIVVIIGLCLMFWYILRVIKRFSENWKKMMRARVDKALEKRKLVTDPFRTINGYSWDYVMVFKVTKAGQKLTEDQKKFSLKFIIDRLADAGLQTKLYFSVQNDEIYVKIRASMKRLKLEADRINYKLLLDSNALSNKLAEGNAKGPPEKAWRPVEVPLSNIETQIDPYEYIYCEYKSEYDLMYKKWPNKSIFRGTDRLKLIAVIIAARLNCGGCFLDIFKLRKANCMVTFFPLHDAVELMDVEERWLRFCQPPWLQHTDVVKDYFGEKIALLFLFLGHYTTWLIPVAIIGFFCWINVASDNNNPNAVLMPYFATFVALWSTVMLEYWKRKEKLTSMRWGMVGFEDDEQARPEFQGKDYKSPVDGSPILYFSPNEFYQRVMVSVSIISTLIAIVLIIVAGIFALRIILSHTSALTVGGTNLGSIITAIINAIQIQILNALYSSVAIALTKYENHRTDTEYEDALIAKTFIFQFVNSFSSLTYISFVKPFILTLDPCVQSGCMSELQSSLGTIFLTRLATGSILKVLIPYINSQLKEKAESKGGIDKDDFTEPERAFIQEEYHVLLGPFGDYADLIIQFGYTTMFIVAYPLATLMSFVSNYVALRINAWKLCQQCRRPEPRSVEDMGTWYIILEIISIAAVLCNAALVAFTGSFTLNYTWNARAWIFVIMSGGIILVKQFVAAYVPDTPLEVDIQLQRQEYFIDKFMHNVPDEDDDGLTANIKSDIKYTIRINDDDPL